MNKRIVTIGRQCGSGGHTIGEMVAEKLGVPFYDKQLLEIVAQRSGLTEKTVQEQGEYADTGLLFSVASTLSYGYNVSNKGSMILPDQINAFQTELIRELAEKESCVIIGRCSDYILRERTDCLHVFVQGDLEDKIARVIREHNIAPENAEHHIRQRDKKRSKYYRYITDQSWGMAENYNLCLDSSEFGIDTCVDTIVDFIKGT